MHVMNNKNICKCNIQNVTIRKMQFHFKNFNVAYNDLLIQIYILKFTLKDRDIKINPFLQTNPEVLRKDKRFMCEILSIKM